MPALLAHIQQACQVVGSSLRLLAAPLRIPVCNLSGEPQ